MTEPANGGPITVHLPADPPQLTDAAAVLLLRLLAEHAARSAATPAPGE